MFNRAQLVPETLLSVQPADRGPYTTEVIVVDDGSTDGGAQLVARAFPWATVLVQHHRGAPAARNRGLMEARGDYVLFLDSDDLLERGFFPPRIECLETHADVDGAYAPWQFFSQSDPTRAIQFERTPKYPIEPKPANKPHLLRLLAGQYLPIHATVWRTHVLRNVGGFDETLEINQDVDLTFRVLVRGAMLAGVEGPSALFREHAAMRQGTQTDNRMKSEQILRLRQRFLVELELAGRLDQAAESSLSCFCFVQWAGLLSSAPDLAEGFLELSRRLGGHTRPIGRLPTRLLARLLGPANAIRLREIVRRRTLVG